MACINSKAGGRSSATLHTAPYIQGAHKLQRRLYRAAQAHACPGRLMVPAQSLLPHIARYLSILLRGRLCTVLKLCRRLSSTHRYPTPDFMGATGDAMSIPRTMLTQWCDRWAALICRQGWEGLQCDQQGWKKLGRTVGAQHSADSSAYCMQVHTLVLAVRSSQEATGSFIT
jgi:hypothetical protein